MMYRFVVAIVSHTWGHFINRVNLDVLCVDVDIKWFIGCYLIISHVFGSTKM